MDKKIYALLAIIVLITIFNLSLVYFVFQYNQISKPQLSNININIPKIIDNLTPAAQGIGKFTSEEDFKDYLSKAPVELTYRQVDMLAGIEKSNLDFGIQAPTIGLGEATTAPAPALPTRISETNVQVSGIDEPDIVKTDGKEIFYSSPSFYITSKTAEPVPMLQENISSTRAIEKPSITEDSGFIAPMPPLPYKQYGGTKTIKAWPPADLKIDSSIDKQGDLLLKNNILVVLSSNIIYGIDVSNPSSPQQKWSVEFDQRNYLETARFYNDKIYLITRATINMPRPCPYIPLKTNGHELSIACTDIYHPIVNIPANSTYNIIALDPQSGDVKEKTSFVGSADSSVVYMSTNAIYVTYNYPGDTIKYILGFFKENKDIIPIWLIDKLTKLQNYDISDNAKLTEFQNLMEQWLNSASSDDLLKLENEMTNRMSNYANKHNRELEQMSIIKIAIDGLKITATGNVPGSPLNQFSLDEYNNNLRVATTIGRRGGPWMGFFGVNTESVSDVYVLDTNLKITGSVQDLGKSERIYSVRFIEDKGYVVTFRQTDPFYVLDLANPNNPLLKGELKIPGYSSYLHPITKDKIIGIGKEDQNVKISIFDVSKPESPSEIAKYTLNEYWSDVLNTHHAFLLDAQHEIFFMPGNKGGYIFSYQNNELKLTKAISDITARRALYLNDYLYIIGDNEVKVFNEKDWQEINKLAF
jgi:uncharacterized secreted protein with C-terminal beta-propeller domain